MMFFNKKNGFGLVEVIVAVGLLSIVGIGFVSLMSNTMKAQKGAQAKDQQREVTSEIRALLSDKQSCVNSLGGQNVLVGFSVTQLRDATNQIRYTVGSNDRSNMLKYVYFKVDNWVADAGYTTQGIASFKVGLEKNGDVIGVRTLAPDIMNMKIKTSVGGAITECFALGNEAGGFWQASPSNSSHIFFSGGNVGVGIDNPRTSLEVQGELKISTTGASCNATTEGAIRYNSGIKNIEFCDGISWKSAGGSGLTGYQIVTNAIGSGGHYDVDVYCPGSKRVIGGGCNQQGGGNRALIDSNPIGTNGWHCRGRDIITPQAVTTTAYAICVD